MSPKTLLEDWEQDPWDDPAELYEFEAERQRHWKHNPVKWIAYTALALLVVAVLLAGIGGFWLARQLNPSGTAVAATNFTVNDGDTLDTLSRRLADLGYITDARVFRWYADRSGGLDAAPGYYSLKKLDSMGNILGALRTPPAQTFTKVTFPEGFTVDQMGRRLERDVSRLTSSKFNAAAEGGDIKSLWSPDGVKSLEGLLFPDTYQVSNKDTEVDVVTRQVRLMEQIGKSEGLDKAQQKIGLTPYQALVVASMVEREAKVPEDRPLIARVILNRLFLQMPLQIDATLFYGQDPNTPFAQLRNLDTPYNTYLHGGLPPTPIANPGRASIHAVLNPAPNPLPKDCPGGQPCAWLYYVLADKDGHHAFATNPADHQRNVDKARAAGLLN